MKSKSIRNNKRFYLSLLTYALGHRFQYIFYPKLSADESSLSFYFQLILGTVVLCPFACRCRTYLSLNIQKMASIISLLIFFRQTSNSNKAKFTIYNFFVEIHINISIQIFSLKVSFTLFLNYF